MRVSSVFLLLFFSNIYIYLDIYISAEKLSDSVFYLSFAMPNAQPAPSLITEGMIVWKVYALACTDARYHLA